jgi:hypothetical protein
MFVRKSVQYAAASSIALAKKKLADLQPALSSLRAAEAAFMEAGKVAAAAKEFAAAKQSGDPYYGRAIAALRAAEEAKAAAGIIKAAAQSVAEAGLAEVYNAVYATDKKDQFLAKFKELSLASTGSTFIDEAANAVIFRHEYGPKADAAIKGVGDSPRLVLAMIAGMRRLQSPFLGMSSAKQIDKATHHIVGGHIVDMSADGGKYLLKIMETEKIFSGERLPEADWTTLREIMERDKTQILSFEERGDLASLSSVATLELIEKLKTNSLSLDDQKLLQFLLDMVPDVLAEKEKIAGLSSQEVLLKGLLTIVTTNALGAAHDIIQGKGPPANEKESAVLFRDQTQAMVRELIDSGDYGAEEIAVLKNYSKDAVPFLANEGITNATRFLYMSGKRDFDNALYELHQVYSDDPDLTPEMAAMKMSLSIADTRRSEMDNVLEKGESIALIEPEDKAIFVKFLQAAGVLTADQMALPEMDSVKMKTIEGFCLRMRSNLNMNSELGDGSGAAITHQMRVGEEPNVDWANQIDQFLAKIGIGAFGEDAFAEQMGKGHEEIKAQARFYGIEDMVANGRLHQGWKGHAKALLALKENLTDHPDKIAIAKLMYKMAAIAPGITFGMGMTQEKYDGLVKHENKLVLEVQSMSMLPDSQEKAQAELELKNITRDINEIEKVNAKKDFIPQERSALVMVITEGNYKDMKKSLDMDSASQVVAVTAVETRNLYALTTAIEQFEEKLSLNKSPAVVVTRVDKSQKAVLDSDADEFKITKNVDPVKVNAALLSSTYNKAPQVEAMSPSVQGKRMEAASLLLTYHGPKKLTS